MTGPARHVLVVASQCDREEEIEGLTEIAASLSDLLSDPDIGCCAAGLPDGTALISGTHDARYIEERLREAVHVRRPQWRYAGVGDARPWLYTRD